MKKVLVIDNFDSFVYNLVCYVGILGGKPLVFRNDVSFSKIKKVIKKERVSHIIISPGPKTPKEAGISNEIIKKFGFKIPILGVCLGHQCIGYVFGGKIKRAKKIKHGKTSLISHKGEGILKGISNPLVATRYHSLVVDRKNLPPFLEITAESLDDKEIMGLRHKKYPIFGLQFHPESILTKEGLKIIENFLRIKESKKL